MKAIFTQRLKSFWLPASVVVLFHALSLSSKSLVLSAGLMIGNKDLNSLNSNVCSRHFMVACATEI